MLSRNGHEIADGCNRMGEIIQIIYFVIVFELRCLDAQRIPIDFSAFDIRLVLGLASLERRVCRNQGFRGINDVSRILINRPENFIHVLYWLKVVILRGFFTAIEIETVIASLVACETLQSRYFLVCIILLRPQPQPSLQLIEID